MRNDKEMWIFRFRAAPANRRQPLPGQTDVRNPENYPRSFPKHHKTSFRTNLGRPKKVDKIDFSDQKKPKIFRSKMVLFGCQIFILTFLYEFLDFFSKSKNKNHYYRVHKGSGMFVVASSSTRKKLTPCVTSVRVCVSE